MSKRLKPDETAEPFIQMCEGRTLGSFFDPVEGRKRRGNIPLKERREVLLDVGGEASKDALVNPGVDEATNAPGHTIQGAKSGKLAVFQQKRLGCSVDQVCGTFHHLGGLVHGTSRNMPDLFATTPDFQMAPNGDVVAVEGRRSDIGHQIWRILHDRADVTNHRSRDGVQIREILQSLIHFEQDHQGKLLGRPTSMCGNKSTIRRGRREHRAQFLHGRGAGETRISRSRNIGHMCGFLLPTQISMNALRLCVWLIEVGEYVYPKGGRKGMTSIW